MRGASRLGADRKRGAPEGSLLQGAQKRVHLAQHIGFIGVDNIVLSVRNADDMRRRHTLFKSCSLSFVNFCTVVRDSINRKDRNRNLVVFLLAEGDSPGL